MPCAASSMSGSNPRSRNSTAFSLARMAVASIPNPLVSRTLSPAWSPLDRTRSSRRTSPSIWPTTIGRSSPAVISVWPPHSETPISPAARRSDSKTDRTRASSVRLSGRSSVARNQRGTAPIVATSLALTWTAYRPISSVAKVIGSVFTTRQVSPKSMTAASSPTSGPTRTRSSSTLHSRSRPESRSSGSLPGGRKAHMVVSGLAEKRKPAWSWNAEFTIGQFRGVVNGFAGPRRCPPRLTGRCGEGVFLSGEPVYRGQQLKLHHRSNMDRSSAVRGSALRGVSRICRSCARRAFGFRHLLRSG